MTVRLRSRRTFGKRIVQSGSKDPKPFFLISIASEGITEEQYFDGIKDYTEKFGITDIIKIERLEKQQDYSTMSHPSHIFELLKERKEYWEEWGVSPDEFWMIIDRDKQDRSEEQLKEIVEKCKEEKFNIALTNPAFELWLLLHLDDLSGYSREEIFINRKHKGKRRFLELELSKKLGSYKKENLDFTKFEDGIRDAIARANKFENRIEHLISNLGTNIHYLIQSFIH